MSGSDNTPPAAPPRKRSRKRWFVWLLLGVLGGAVVYVREPPIYRAQTAILIIPQRVPERFVQPTVTADLRERLTMIQQQILSRTRLERLIQEFNLYANERQRFIMEDVIEMMRMDIRVFLSTPRNDDESVHDFSVSFESTDPRMAMRVTERLASLFVQENVEDRALLADQTTQFLEAQIEDTRNRLLTSDMHLREARRRNLTFSSFAAEHEVLVEHYKKLLAFREAAQLAVNVERRQVGEQFKIIDGARLPERPISIRLFPYLALGALTGLGAGIVAAMASSFWRRRHPVAH